MNQDFTRRGFLFGGAALVGSALLESCKGSTPEPITPPAPTPDLTAFAAIAQAASRRVDLVMIGDSNQLKDGTGWDHGFNYALGNQFGLYASAIYGNGYTQQGSDMSGGGRFGVTTGGPTAGEAFDLASQPYAFMPTGTPDYNNNFNGVTIGQASKLDVNSALRCWFSYLTFTTGTGSFRPGARIEKSPYTAFGQSDIVSTKGSSEANSLSSFTLPAAKRDAPIGFKWALPNYGKVVAPFQGFFMRVEDTVKTNGVSVHTLYGEGGQSLWDMATQLNTYTLTKLKNYFAEVRRLQLSQNQSPIVVVYINSGLNDQNETSTPSLGPSPSSLPTSAEAYKDNLEGIMRRIEAVWDFAKWDKKELHFLLMPSHPTNAPDAAKLISYRQAASELAKARTRTSFVDLTTLTTSTEMLEKGWYLGNGADKFHLNQAAYETLSTRVTQLFKA